METFKEVDRILKKRKTLSIERSLFEDKAASETGFISSMKKHDRSRLELSLALEYYRSNKIMLETEMFLFFPKSVNLHSWSEDELKRDFNSNLRLSIPFLFDFGHEAIEEAKKALLDFTNNSKKNEQRDENFFDLMRHLAAVASEVIYNFSLLHKGKIREMISEASQEEALSEFHALEFLLLDVSKVIQNTREFLHALTSGYKLNKECVELVMAFEDYLSYQYVNYLGKLDLDLTKALESVSHQEQKSILQRRIDSLRVKIKSFLKLESVYQISNLKNKLFENFNLMKLSQLKKFFHSTFFFNIISKKSRQSVSEIAAIIGATIAALGAYFAEAFNPKSWLLSSSSGITFISFGIFLYVLKDRLKDKLRSALLQVAGPVLPDLKRTLISNRDEIGVSKIWVNVTKKNSVPENIQTLRSKCFSSSLEKNLGEDILMYRHVLKIKGTKLWNEKSRRQGLRETTRINLERHLRYFDESFKNIFRLDETGEISQARLHRTYNFYLSVKINLKTSNKNYASGEKMTFYRIVLDKKGILDVEEMD